jgi:hypothetical protein
VKSILSLIVWLALILAPVVQARPIARRGGLLPVAAGGGSAPAFSSASTLNTDLNADSPETWTFGQLALTTGYVVVHIAYYNTAKVSGVTYDGAAMTKIAEKSHASTTELTAELWGLAVGTKGSGTYTISVAGVGGSRFEGIVSAWTGVNQATPVGTAAVGSATSTTASTTVTSAATTEVVVDCYSSFAAGTITATIGSGQTSIFNQTNAASLNGAGSSEPGAASVVMDWSLSGSTDWAAVGISIKGL